MEDAGEVLELARTALARHRNWMATRRVQRTVAPLRSSENTSSQDVPGKIQPATWAVKNNSSTLPHTSAPPLSEKTAVHPAKKPKAKNNRIAPSKGWSPDPGGGNGERKTLSPALKPIFFSHLEKEVENEMREDENETLPKDDVPPDSPLTLEDSWTRNSPSWSTRGGLLNGHHADGLVEKDISGGEESGVAATEVVEPSTDSPPPYVMSTTAWGEGGRGRGGGNSSRSSSDLGGRQGPVHDNVVALSQGSEELETLPMVIPTTPALLSRGNGPKHRTLMLPLSPQVANEKSTSGVENSELERQEVANEYDSHYSMARLVAVSPAPREQRTSFSSHTKSKLGLSDALGRAAYNYSSVYPGAEGVAREEGALESASWSKFHETSRSHGTGGQVPEASLRMVKPLKAGRTAMEGLGRGLGDQPPTATRSEYETSSWNGAIEPGEWRRSPQDESVLLSRSGHPSLGKFKGEESLIITDLEESELVEGDGYVVGKTAAGDNSSPSREVVKEGRSMEPPIRVGSKKPGKLPAELKKKSKKSLSKEKTSVKVVQDSQVKPQLRHQPKPRNSQDQRRKTALPVALKTTESEGETCATEFTSQDTIMQQSFSSVTNGDESLKVDSLGPSSRSSLDASKDGAPTDKDGALTIKSPHLEGVKLAAKNVSSNSIAEPVVGGVAMAEVVDGNKLVKELPPLRVTSLLSSSLTGGRVHPKRSRAPPSYDIHRPQGSMVLSPPCPLYGEKQPKEADTLKQIASQRRASLSSWKTLSSNSAGPEGWSKPEWSRSKSTGVTDHMAQGLQRSSSTLVLNKYISGKGSSLARAKSERDVSDLGGSGHAPQASTMPGFSPGPGPLHIAAKLGNLRRVQALLDQGHDVDLPDDNGRTPLIYCVQDNGVHLSCADALIKYGANLDKQTSDGATVVHMACGVGAVSLLELLLLNHAKADVQDFDGRRPIHWATFQSSTKIFSLLLKSCSGGAGGLESVDDAGMTVLMWAAYHDNHRIVSHLMDLGAESMEKDKDGYTAMHWAIHREGSRSLQLLLVPDMTYFKDHSGKTLMHMAAEKGSMAACEVVLKLRPDAIHDRDKKGRTPLHYGAACSRVDVCALLLDYGADATQRDQFFKTALDYARDKKLDYVVALLSCHGNAVADFARASRSLSVTSLLNRSISFSQLPITGEAADGDVVSHTLSTLSLDNQSFSSPSPRPQVVGGLESPSMVSGVTTASDSWLATADPAKGDYLGRFFPDDKDLVKHFFFKVDESEGSLSWWRSREGSQSNRRPGGKVLVLEVHREPSNSVRNHPRFSAGDLHCYSFWLATSGGVLDLLAYNEESYNLWLLELERVAARNERVGHSALRTFKGSSVHAGVGRHTPLPSSGGTRHSAKVAVAFPSGVEGLSGGRGVGGEQKTADMSMFFSDHRMDGYGVDGAVGSRKVPSKNVRVAPSGGPTQASTPHSDLRAGLSFVGESYRSELTAQTKPDLSDLQATVI